MAQSLAEEIARHTAVSITAVRRLICTYNRVAAGSH
jgi:hypothetical protein